MLVDSLDGATECNYAANHFIGILENDKFLAVDQADDGIGRGVDVLDQIRIQNQRDVVYASNVDHTLPRISAKAEQA
ncbi:MAG TPA: hypothetical protein VKS01_01650 [Bryobacteraceae bacterium]|nr:hypothetical protein [Bryobacteraceae bacterium]